LKLVSTAGVVPRDKLALAGITVTLTLDGATFEGVPAIPQLISTIATTHSLPRVTARNQLSLPRKIAAARIADCVRKTLCSPGIPMGAALKARGVPHRGGA